MKYRDTRPVMPKAASNFVRGRPFNVLMNTLYVAARVLRGRSSHFAFNAGQQVDLLKTADPEKARELPRHNIERRSCHEAADCRCRNELDEPSETE